MYGLGNALTRFCGLLVFPIYTRILSYEEFAAQDLALSFSVFLIILAGLGLDTAFARLFNERDGQGRTDLATTWGILTLLCSLPIILLAFVFQEQILALARIDVAHAGTLFSVIIIASCALLMLRQLTMTLRLQRKPVRFAVVSLSTAITQVVFALLFVAVFNWGIVGVGLATMVSSLTGLVVGVCATGWIWNGSFRGSDAKAIVAYGLPFLPAALSVWGLDSLNRFILQNVTDPTETAIYGVGIRVSSLVAVFLFGFQMSWHPFAYRLMREPNVPAQPFISAANWLWFLGGSTVAVIGIFSAEATSILASESYDDSRHVVFWMGFAALLWTFFHIASSGYQYAKKTKHNIYSVVIGLLVVLMGSPFAAKLWGATGVSVMSFLGYWVTVLIAAWRANKYWKIDFRWGRIFCWQVFLLAICLGSNLEFIGSTALVLAIKSVVAGTVVIIGYHFILDNAEQKLFLQRLRFASEFLWRRFGKS